MRTGGAISRHGESNKSGRLTSDPGSAVYPGPSSGPGPGPAGFCFTEPLQDQISAV